MVRKSHPVDSFFNFFTPPVLPDDDALENGEIDEDELEELEEKVEMDYQIGEDLKEKVSSWPACILARDADHCDF
jgi:nucleosome assembly protein 1-like 1